MSISITLGKSRIFPINATLSNGAPDTTTTCTAETNQASSVKVAMNPANNRELGVLALAPTTGATVIARCGTFIPSITVSVPTPTLASVTFGADGGEVDPPAWLVNA